MLLSKTELEAIRAGRLTLLFRRWRRPTVKTGGSLNTAVGVLGIVRVVQVEGADISERDALTAGYASLEALLGKLDSREGEIYRIELRFAGADPRIALRESCPLNDADVREVQAKLARLDAASRAGDWTRTVLQSIAQHPHVAAAKLAALGGFDKDRLKHNIRKLKALGLTISHASGYELSPRGVAVLRSLDNPR